MVRLQGIFVVAVALFLSMMLPSGSWSVVEESVGRGGLWEYSGGIGCC